MKINLPIRLVASCVVAASFVFAVSCKSKDESSSSVMGSGTDLGPLQLASTAVAYLPESTFGFLTWDRFHPAYEKLSQSAWGTKDTLKSLKETLEQNKDNPALKILEKIGVDPFNEASTRELLSKGAVFIAAPQAPAQPPAAGSEPAMPGIGAVAVSKNPSQLTEKMGALKRELTAANAKVKDEQITTGSAFSFDLSALAPKQTPEDLAANGPEDAKKEVRAFVGMNGDRLAVGSSSWVLNSALSTPGSELPSLVKSAEFSRATSDFPGNDTRFMTGFFDVTRAVTALTAMGAEGELKEVTQGSPIPIQALAFSSAMEETPVTIVRGVLKPETDTQKQVVQALSSSSTSEAVFNAVPNDPLLILTLDGTSLKKFKDDAATTGGDKGKAFSKLFMVLDTMKRLSLSARVAPPGASMMPVPDLLIAVESSNPAGTKDELTKLGTLAIGTSGMAGPDGAGSQWTEQDIDGTPVKSFITPFGMGLFIAAKGSVVLVASSEAQIRASLSAVDGKGGSFAKTASDKAKNSLSQKPTLLGLYVDMTQVAKMIENLSGMMSMFAPPSMDGEGGSPNQMVKPEQLAAMRKMGSFVVELNVKDNNFEARSFYDRAGAGETTAKPAG